MENKKFYKEPEMNVVEFENEDVITTSGNALDNNPWCDDDNWGDLGL